MSEKPLETEKPLELGIIRFLTKLHFLCYLYLLLRTEDRKQRFDILNLYKKLQR